MKKLLFTIWLMVIAIGIVGCYQDTTGGWHLSQNAANAIESGTDAAAGVAGIVSIFVPAAAGVAGIAAGIAGAVKKLKPQLTKNKKVSEHVVSSLETLKENDPETWTKVVAYLKDKTNADVELAIDEIIKMLEKDNNDA